MLQHSQHFWISVALKQAVGHLQKIFKTNLLVKSNISIADFRLGRAYGDRKDMSPLRERGHLAPVGTEGLEGICSLLGTRGHLSPITFGGYINPIQNLIPITVGVDCVHQKDLALLELKVFHQARSFFGNLVCFKHKST